MKSSDPQPEVTLGEVYRLVVKIDTRLEKKEEWEAEIDAKVSRHDWALKTIGAIAFALLAAAATIAAAFTPALR